MNIDLVLFFVFILVLLILMVLKRKKLKLEKIAFPFIYMVLYRTKIGLKLMDKVDNLLAEIHKFYISLFYLEKNIFVQLLLIPEL